MKIKTQIKKYFLEIVYFITTIFFLIKLSRLNEELLYRYSFSDDFEMLCYKDYLPIKFFAITLCLIIVGIILGIRRINNILYVDLGFKELIEVLGILMLLLIMIILLIAFIDNPILRAIISVICCITFWGYGAFHSKI